MDELLQDEQVELFGVEGALLGMLQENILRLTAAVAQRDPSQAAETLELLREDVASMLSGLEGLEGSD